MAKRSTPGRALFYTRDSGGRNEHPRSTYVLWAQGKANEIGVSFTGTVEQVAEMIRNGESAKGDLFLDFGVTGNVLSRAGLNALIRRAAEDLNVSHVFMPRRDRLARPEDPIDAVKLESKLSRLGLTLVFMDRVVPPSPKGRRRDVSELICAMVDYESAGNYRRQLAEKILHAQIALARAGYACGAIPRMVSDVGL